MHVWFRQYAQQMGMQNVRAILPEQIDVLINTSISDYVNEIIRTNIGLTNDRIVTDNSKIGQINALRTLMRTAEIVADDTYTYNEGNTEVTRNKFTHFDSVSNGYKLRGLTTPYYKNGVKIKEAEITDVLHLIDFSVNYYTGKDFVDERSYTIDDSKITGTTSWYPVRLIENMYLADTLQDFVMSPKLRAPICVLYGKEPDNLDIYFGKKYIRGGGFFKRNQVYFATLRVNYLGTPAKVMYAEDLVDAEDVNCDLPEYTHVDILKHAVDLYRVAIQGSLYANQQQQQTQQREIGRNNVRPDNEGYQQ